ncbi:MAG: hypothetical protein M3461_06150 [Pseudomonadota bacterium]|nr:hypothetical protein [Pseudomonadota bacterium]
MPLDVYRKTKDGRIVYGKGFSAFIHNGNYYQTVISVYEDGMVDCWGLVTFEEFREKVAEGWVVTRVPRGAHISCHHLYFGKCLLNFPVTETDFVGELQDEVKRLRGEDDSSTLCVKAFAEFLRAPTLANRECLRFTYSFIPTHLRIYTLGDMDSKDAPLRRIIADQATDADIQAYRQQYKHLLDKEG